MLPSLVAPSFLLSLLLPSMTHDDKEFRCRFIPSF